MLRDAKTGYRAHFAIGLEEGQTITLRLLLEHLIDERLLAGERGAQLAHNPKTSRHLLATFRERDADFHREISDCPRIVNWCDWSTDTAHSLSSTCSASAVRPRGRVSSA